MRKGGGKQKGAAFEREVCVMLSKWLTSGEQEDVFWRSAMSGGRSTVAFKRGKQLASQVGDISCIHPAGQHFINTFAVECKFYASLDFQGIPTGTGKLFQFWAEINKQAQRYEKSPFMIAKQNRMPTHVYLTRESLCFLEKVPLATFISPPHNLFAFELVHFLAETSPFV